MSDGELEIIFRDLHSPEDATRAQTIRRICPCRMGWEAFQQSMAIVARLKKDPSPLVRRAALHVFQDAFEMQSSGLPTTPQEITNEMAARKRRLRWRPEEDEGPATVATPEGRMEMRKHLRATKRNRPR